MCDEARCSVKISCGQQEDFFNDEFKQASNRIQLGFHVVQAINHQFWKNFELLQLNISNYLVYKWHMSTPNFMSEGTLTSTPTSKSKGQLLSKDDFKLEGTLMCMQVNEISNYVSLPSQSNSDGRPMCKPVSTPDSKSDGTARVTPMSTPDLKMRDAHQDQSSIYS